MLEKQVTPLKLLIIIIQKKVTKALYIIKVVRRRIRGLKKKGFRDDVSSKMEERIESKMKKDLEVRGSEILGGSCVVVEEN